MDSTQEPATKGDLQASETRILERMETNLQASEIRMLERLEKIETNILTAFHKWAQGTQKRLSILETVNHSDDERLAGIEARLLDLELKRRPPQ